MTRPPVEDHLPLKPRTFALLSILRESPAHGYGLMQALEERTGGSLSIDAGLLYRTLARLLEAGLVRPARKPPVNEDARRKYYEITAFGEQVVSADLERQQRLLGELLPASAPRDRS